MIPLLLFFYQAGQAKPISKPAFVRVFAQVEHKQLRPDKAGAISLAKTDAHLTTNGKIYVTRHKGLLMVLFPLWIGKGSNLRGVLLCNRVLGSSETQSLTLFAPGAWGSEDKSSSYSIAPSKRQTEVVVEREVWPHAYRVSRTLD